MTTTPKYQSWSPNLKHVNDEFAILQNVRFLTRNDDGDFADVTRIAMKKRYGTVLEGGQISASSEIHSQIFFRNATTDYYLAFDGGNMRRRLIATLDGSISSIDTTISVDSTTGFPSSGTIYINGDAISYTGTTATTFTGVTGISAPHADGSQVTVWSTVSSGLTSGDVSGVSVTSYGGTATDTGTAEESYSRTWTANQTYDATSGTTTFTDTSGAFPTDDSLIGFLVYPNTTDGQYAGNGYNIIAHTSTTIVVAGDVPGAFNGKAYKVVPSTESTTLLDKDKSWTQDAYKGDWVVITAGTGLGQARRISSNESSYLTIGIPWDVQPDSTSQYAIYDDANDTNVLYLGNASDVLRRYDGTTLSSLANRPKGNIITEYQGRIIMAGDTANPFSLYYSQIANPEYFDPSFVIRPKGFDKITGVSVWNEKAIIFKERSVWAFEFVYNSVTDNYDVALQEVPSATGAINNKCICKVGEGEIWYYDGKEVQMLGSSPSQIGVLRTKSISFPINNILDGITVEQARSACMDTDGKIVRFSIPAAGLFFEYDLKYSVWSTRTGNTAYSLLVDADKNWYYGDNDGNVYLMDKQGHYDDGGIYRTDGIATGGEAIDQRIASKALDFGDRNLYKNFRYVDYTFENETSSFVYTVSIYSKKHKFVYSDDKAIGYNTGEGSEGQFGTAQFGETAIGGANPVLNTFGWRVSIGRDPGTFAIIEARNNKSGESMTLIGLGCTWKARSVRHFPSQFIT